MAVEKFLAFQEVDAENFSNFGNRAPCILGIDEAGRGPVLGPMVYGCAVVFADKERHLKDLGVDDSKALSDAQRQKIFAKMLSAEFVTHSLSVVHPRVISIQMQRRMRQSLNKISQNCAIGLIRRVLENGICLKEVFVDLVGSKPEPYQSLLQSHFPSLKITVSKKADSIYPIVGAASIAAKVTRDRLISEWVFEEKGFSAPSDGIGSGYPSDPVTKRFISKSVDPVFGFPSLVRFSWKTVEKVLDRRTVKCTWNVSSTEASEGLKQRTLLDLWKCAKTKQFEKEKEGVEMEERGKVMERRNKAKFKRHVFFTERGLSNVDIL